MLQIGIFFLVIFPCKSLNQLATLSDVHAPARKSLKSCFLLCGCFCISIRAVQRSELFSTLNSCFRLWLHLRSLLLFVLSSDPVFSSSWVVFALHCLSFWARIVCIIWSHNEPANYWWKGQEPAIGLIKPRVHMTPKQDQWSSLVIPSCGQFLLSYCVVNAWLPNDTHIIHPMHAIL